MHGLALLLVTRIFFDARAPHHPLVEADVGGHTRAMLLDTGSVDHVYSLERARAEGLALGAPGTLDDVDLRRHTTAALDVVARVAGLALTAPLIASDWPDSLAPPLPGQRQEDGVLSPQRLARPGRAVVLDFVRGEISDEPWAQALAHVGREPRALADVAAGPTGHFFVAATVGGRAVRLVVDTGAPRSMLYEARGDELPSGAVRVSFDHQRLDVGGVRRSLVFEHREPTVDMSWDGLLGMDVLSECVLAVDATRLVARCKQPRDLGAPAGDLSLYRPRVQIGVGGPWMEQLVEGGYHFDGDGCSADIARDGTVSNFDCWSQRPLGMRSQRDERAWFMDATAELRHELSRAESLRTSFDRLPRLLAWVWRDWPPSEAREIIFRIWDECAEPDDAELGAAGEHARKMIDRFVRKTLPPGSRDQFTDDELRRFNQRRVEGPRFDPYRPQRDESVAIAF